MLLLTVQNRTPSARLMILLPLFVLLAFGCSSGKEKNIPMPPEEVVFNDPVPDPTAAAEAFRLFYRERVDRAVLAYNRFGIFGDSVFATTIGSKAIAKQGNEYEIIPGPTDNNLIGTTAFGVWHAYKVFRTRSLALSLIRLFEGIAFVEQVTGIPGLTVREALPGWTRVMDGITGTVTRTRFTAPVVHPWPPSPLLEDEVLETFYNGILITYRENPGEFMFQYKPVDNVAGYSITYSIDERPHFIRVSNCCRSSMQTPDGYPWAGAWWGNHNSRDNLPDLALGIIAAMDAAEDATLDPDLRQAAQHAVEAGRRIGDLIQASEGNLMTVDEYHAYGDLTVGGTVRPHGDPENQDLGSMSACPSAYLAPVMSTAGLGLPFPVLPLPGEIEEMILRDLFNCDLDLPIYFCDDINDAYFETTYATLLQSEPFGLPWLDIVELLDTFSPGLAGDIIGSFQNDYDDIVESTMAVVHYARVMKEEALEEAARAALLHQTNLMRRFADAIFTRTRPDERRKQRYEAAVFDAIGGLPPIQDDFAGFDIAEGRILAIEQLLEMEDTQPKDLMTDVEIKDIVENALAHEKLSSVVQRYHDTYGFEGPDGYDHEPPVRRDGNGYVARTSTDLNWSTVDNPRHRHYGGPKLLQEIPICVHAPEILDCTWAVLGCTVADLDSSGLVDDADLDLFEAAFANFQDTPEDGCIPANGWCGGADLDRTGELSTLDSAFMEAARGCTHES